MILDDSPQRGYEEHVQYQPIIDRGEEQVVNKQEYFDLGAIKLIIKDKRLNYAYTGLN